MSEAKVIPFKVIDGTPKTEINVDAIEYLETLLAEARVGTINAVAVVYARPNHVVGTGWCRTHALGMHLLASGAASLLARMTKDD